jgi:hypothetical protein
MLNPLREFQDGLGDKATAHVQKVPRLLADSGKSLDGVSSSLLGPPRDEQTRISVSNHYPIIKVLAARMNWGER